MILVEKSFISAILRSNIPYNKLTTAKVWLDRDHMIKITALYGAARSVLFYKRKPWKGKNKVENIAECRLSLHHNIIITRTPKISFQSFSASDFAEHMMTNHPVFSEWLLWNQIL